MIRSGNGSTAPSPNSPGNAPARCQPRTIGDSSLLAPFSSTPRLTPSGFSACRMTMMTVMPRNTQCPTGKHKITAWHLGMETRLR